MSAVDNVTLPMVFKGISKSQRKTKALSLLRSVGLKERMYHDSNLLSGGEQQRVAIARSLVNNPKILIADEPTGGLDLANATEIMETIYSLYKERNTTIILSTHNPNYAKFADKVIYIQKGEVTVQRSIKSATR
jgi:putative ABC transport system ATP-binding protein